MNEIRKNTEEEKVILEGQFKFSLGAAWGWIIGGIITFSFWFIPFRIAQEVKDDRQKMMLTMIYSIALFVLLIFNGYQIFKACAIKKNKLTITNKRIYGIRHVLIAKKSYSCRLDEIDNVEIHSSFGRHTLSVQFSQGNRPQSNANHNNGMGVSGGSGTLIISNLKNVNEINEALNKLMTETKNLVDLDTDLKLSRIEAENRKAEALEQAIKANKSSNNSDYIEELKKLKELYDQGIITKEEFEQEKKEILDSNHK